MHGAIDAGGDPDAAGSDDVGRYYIVEFTSAAYELRKRLRESDWGALPRGTRVVDARHTNLVPRGPGRQAGPRLYTTNPHALTLPVEQVVHRGFAMEPARLPARGGSAMLRQAVSKGALVLAESAHLAIMEELRARGSSSASP